jgi:hypothetical protein
LGKIDPAQVIFLDELKKHVPNSSPAHAAISQEIAENHMTDLAPTQGFFTPETQDLLSAEAARRFAKKCAGLTTHQEMRKGWGELARDFHSSDLWNFPTVSHKVKRPKKKNIAVTMMVTTFTSFVGTKCLVLYFGSAEVNDPSTVNQIGLVAAILFSFGTLFYFAFKNGKAFQEEEKDR